MPMFGVPNCKGQTSFELVLVLSVVVIISLSVAITGVVNINEISALAFANNGYNEYKVKENSDVEVSEIKLEQNSIEFVSEESLNNFNSYKVDIEENIKSYTKFDNINVVG